MKISDYDIDLEKAKDEINKKKHKKICIQLPEGLKIHLEKIIDFFEKNTDSIIYINADPCFGACDIIFPKLINLEIDLVIQIGHLPIPNLKDKNTLFINAKSTIDPKKYIINAIPKLTGKKIGILTTAQHISYIQDIEDLLKSNGFISVLGKGDLRISQKGQILGCNFSSARSISEKVDCFLFFGSGNFHALGLILSTNKPVVSVDPYTGKIMDNELMHAKDIILRQRYGAIARSKDAKSFGILISSKPGQQRLDEIKRIEKLIQSKQKRAYRFILDYISPQTIEGFRNIDCFVSTACPRIAIDDYMQYKVPIITPIELEILLGEKDWEEYVFDEIV